MGRENGEDYRTDFLVLLETWEAAANKHSSRDEGSTQPVDIAKFLGYTRLWSKCD